MSNKRKIKIEDDSDLRDMLFQIYAQTSQKDLAKWAIALSKHIFEKEDVDYRNYEAVVQGYAVNELWQKVQARMHDVRQVGFTIHKIARDSEDEVLKTVLRVAGQAVAVGHMREHAIVASDYAIKYINLKHPSDVSQVSMERQWQIDKLYEIID